MDLTKYGHWDGPDRFVFDPPLVRQGIELNDVDFTRIRIPPELSREDVVELSREDVVEAYIRDRLEFYPAKPPTAEMLWFAATAPGAHLGTVYTGKRQLEDHVTVQCVVCRRTAQVPAGKAPKPGKFAVCSQACLDKMKADPDRYLGKE